MNKLLNLLVAVLISGSLISPAAFAHNDSGKDSLVALGDSIPFGYNLGADNSEPAKTAFPYLIGEEGDLRVRNLGTPGWQTDHLLAALTDKKKYRKALKHADYVTVTIGSNDLLEMLREAAAESGGNEHKFQLLLQQKLASSDIDENLTAILQHVRSLTDAPIVLYNVYNPFQAGHSLHSVANSVLPSINTAISHIGAQFSHVYVADAFAAFGDNQARYVIPGDVHPTVAGQEVLASIGVDALDLD